MLQEFGLKYKTDKAYRHYFCATYEKLLKRDVQELWEIGVLNGASLNMWASYYCEARVIGFDILDKSSVKVLPNVETRQLDQGNEKELANLARKKAAVDIIVDDGSHIVEHQIRTFEMLFDCLKPGGQYVIEDLHTSTDFCTGYGFIDGKGALQYLQTIAEGKVPADFPGQTADTEAVMANIEQIIIITNCNTRDKRSITSIITHK